MRIVVDNAADRATITASDVDGLMVPSNLVNGKKSRLWRARGKAARLSLAWAALEALSCAALPACNLSPTATMRVRATSEPVSTNILKYSEAFDNAVWVKTRATIAPNVPGILAPDGTATVDKLCNNGIIDSNGYVKQTFTADGSTFYVASAYVFAGDITTAQLDLVENNGTAYVAAARCTLDLTTGVASTLYPNSKVINCGGGWYRIVVGGIPVAGTAEIRLSLPVDPTAGTAGYYIWGAQVEVGSLSSYYPSADSFTSRGSVGTYFDSTGTLQTAAVNVARMSYTPDNLSAPAKLLLEAAATNSVRNNTMAGAVVGTPGTLPTNWNASLSGLNYQVVGTGSEKGIPYVNLRIYGTATGSSAGIRFDSNGAVAAASGQAWCGSIFMRRTAGSTANLSKLCLDLTGYNSSLVASSDDIQGPNLLPSLSTGNLAISRFNAAGILSDSTTAYVRYQILLTFATGSAIDITLAIGMPQLEQGLGPTAAIATSSTAVTRSADVSSSAAATRPLGYIDTWQSYDYDSGTVTAAPASARRVHGLTDAQSAGAYGLGGGTCAVTWFNPVNAYGMAIDISDPNNLQGYVEASFLVAGKYWQTAFNPTDAQVGYVDDAVLSHMRSSDQWVDGAGVRKKMSLILSNMPKADRPYMLSMLRTSRAYPALVSVMHDDSDPDVVRDYTIFGRRPQDSDISIDYCITYSMPVTILEA